MRLILLGAFLFFRGGVLGQTYMIRADRIVDVRNNKVLDHPLIRVYKNKIVDLQATQSVSDSAIFIDLTGYTLLPGLMDVHTHVLAGVPDYDKDLYENTASFRALRSVSYLSTSLQNGFTTIRDVCTEGAGFADVDISRAIILGYISGPRLIPSGKGIAATNFYMPMPRSQNWELDLPSGTQYATGNDECMKAVREQVSRGVQWIKLYSDWLTPTFSFEEIKTIVTEAAKYHVSVAAHATTKEGIRMAIMAGVKSIEHGDSFDDSLIQLAVRNHVYWSPTISVYEYYRESTTLNGLYKSLKVAMQSKLKIVCGTDIGSFPWTINQAKELEYYVTKGGLSPMEAIQTATLNAAELLGLEGRLGSLEKGFLADIIAVKGNPLEDITRLQNVAFVMKEGVIYKQPASK